MKIRIKSRNPELIQELDEDEISYLDDAMSIPISEMPFSNIFGDKYRIIKSFGTLKEDSPFGKIVNTLKYFGWELAPREKGDKGKIMLTKKYNETKFTFNEDNTTKLSRPEKVVQTSLVKWANGAYSFLTRSLPSMYAKSKQLEAQQRQATANLPREMEARKAAIKEMTDKFYKPRRYMEAKITSNVAKWFNSAEFMTEARYLVPPTEADEDDIRIGWENGNDRVYNMILERIQEIKQFTDDNKAMYKIQDGFDEEFQSTYMIYSRHPIDVFRMSDFTQITSCHTPRSRRGETNFPETWDQYNICALAEAYANGMVVYSVPLSSFEKAEITPTQEGIDEYEDSEIFADDTRGTDGLEPTARLRIRNTVATDPETGDTTSLAVPDQIVYGTAKSEFKTSVRDFIASAQLEEIQKIFDNPRMALKGEITQQLGLSDGTDGRTFIPLKNFERFGGSYEDGSATVRNNLPLMLVSALGIKNSEIDLVGDLTYDESAQNELKEILPMGPSLEAIESRLGEAEENMSFAGRYKVTAGIDQDYDDNFFYHEINLELYVPLPEYMTDITEEDPRGVNDFFGYHDAEFSLYFNEIDIPPSNIEVFSKNEQVTKMLGFEVPFLKLKYNGLETLMRQAGVDLDINEPEEVLHVLVKGPMAGGFGASVLTDPYEEEAFPQKAAGLLNASEYGRDPEFYLTKILNNHLNSDGSIGAWEEEELELDYHSSGVQWYERAKFRSEMYFEPSDLIEMGMTPEQAAAFAVALNTNAQVQQMVTRLINKNLEPDINPDLVPISVIDNAASYGALDLKDLSMEDIVSGIKEDPSDAIVYTLEINIDSNDIDTAEQGKLLESILTEWDSAFGLSGALDTSDGEAFLRQVIQATSQPVTERKRRTRVRILRG